MKFQELQTLLQAIASPIVLLEGVRALPEADRDKLVRLATHLALTFPSARFRSGNAPGADAAFAAGVRAAAGDRLELVVPHARHRRAVAPDATAVVAFPDLGRTAEEHADYVTRRASPAYATL